MQKKWQPIETCPIRTNVLLLWKKWDHVEDGRLDDGHFVLFDGESLETHPDYWLPIPPIPK